ncbi:ankyrin-1-like [Thraustotheca clavata]|uniref:Ankyrin-1-like n=1 Tax=Thraustotheca clavata TaxID=74557 RepID=A0A1V9ZQ65_9STRA|nr:ankyrin-1-like [Thraustotheca clavata]
MTTESNYVNGTSAAVDILISQAATLGIVIPSELGCLELLKYLLFAGVDINTVDSESGMTPLYAAARAGDESLVERILDFDYKTIPAEVLDIHDRPKSNYDSLADDLYVYINQRSKYDETALHVAIRKGHLATAKVLLTRGADVLIRNGKGRDAFKLARRNGWVEIAILVLHTPLQIASKRGHREIVRLLLPLADIDQLDKDGESAIMKAVSKDEIEIVQMLAPISNLNFISLRTNLGALHSAIARSSIEIVESLIPYANINQPNTQKKTPLYLACEYHNHEVVEILLKHEASPTVSPDFEPLIERDGEQHGYNPFLAAVLLNAVEVVRVFLANLYPAQLVTVLTSTAKSKKNAAILAAERGFSQIIAIIANYKIPTPPILGKYHILILGLKTVDAPFESELIDTNTLPILVAARCGHVDIVQHYLLYQTDFTGINDLSPLHVASIFNKANVAKFLLDRKFEVNCKTKNEEIPLHFAALCNAVDVVPLLLQYGADVNATANDINDGIEYPEKFMNDARPHNIRTNSIGYSALHLACWRNMVKSAELLLTSNDIDVNLPEHTYMMTPLHVACACNALDTVKLLVAHLEVDVNRQDKEGCSGYTLSAMYGFLDVTIFLSSIPRVDISIETNLGYNALMVALKDGQVHVASFLAQEPLLLISMLLTPRGRRMLSCLWPNQGAT